MKKLLKIITASIAVLEVLGCASTNVAVSPSEIEYTEISAETYFNSNVADLYASNKGYKISDVYILGADTKTENGTEEVFFKLDSYRNAWHAHSVYATDFIKNISQNDPTWTDRIDSVENDDKYNGHYTVYVYAVTEGDFFFGYTTKVFVYDIENVPTQKQIDDDKRIRAEEEAAKAKAEKEARAAKDAKAKSLAKGYVYHGIENDEKNRKLFANGALEEGHAYYISGFVVKYGGSMAAIEYGDGFFFSSRSSAVSVDYISQKVKAEIVEAGVETLLGKSIEIPLKVVVAGGKGILKTPVVLGLIREDKNGN